MGREVRRVPKNFEWPLKKVWEGYINPYYQYNKNCPFCDGSGYNPETKELSDTWYSFDDRTKEWVHSITQDEVQALLDCGRLMDFTHEIIDGKWVKKNLEHIPTAEEINEWSKKTVCGHDGINRMICIETRAKRLGVYGWCEHCDGQGVIWLKDEYRELYDNWESYDPPSGEWYQLWETTSEGSPVSPPFETPEELAKYLADNRVSTFASMTTTYNKWLSFIKESGFALSMVYQNGQIKSGVDACGEDE